MKPEWAYDPKRKAVFDLSKRDEWGLHPIVAAAVEPEEGRLIEAAPRMCDFLEELDVVGMGPNNFREMHEEVTAILAAIDGEKG